MLVPHGKPYAGKLHVRFDEGAGAPDEGRSALLYLCEINGIMYAMRPLRNFKTNQCCHLISRIANCAKLDLIDFKPATNVLRFRDMGGSEDE